MTFGHRPKRRTDSCSEVSSPHWNISTEHLTYSSYAFTGTSNMAGEHLQPTMTH